MTIKIEGNTFAIPDAMKLLSEQLNCKMGEARVIVPKEVNPFKIPYQT